MGHGSSFVSTTHNRNLKISSTSLKSQAQGTSLFTRTVMNRRGCPQGSTG